MLAINIYTVEAVNSEGEGVVTGVDGRETVWEV